MIYCSMAPVPSAASHWRRVATLLRRLECLSLQRCLLRTRLEAIYGERNVPPSDADSASLCAEHAPSSEEEEGYPTPEPPLVRLCI